MVFFSCHRYSEREIRKGGEEKRNEDERTEAGQTRTEVKSNYTVVDHWIWDFRAISRENTLRGGNRVKRIKPQRHVCVRASAFRRQFNLYRSEKTILPISSINAKENRLRFYGSWRTKIVVKHSRRHARAAVYTHSRYVTPMCVERTASDRGTCHCTRLVSSDRCASGQLWLNRGNILATRWSGCF